MRYSFYFMDVFENAARMSLVVVTAPKMPPSSQMVSNAASCRSFRPVAVASETMTQSRPMSSVVALAFYLTYYPCALRKPKLTPVSHSCRHAHIRGNATDNEILDTAIVEQKFQIRVLKRAAAGLVDDGLRRERRQLRDDIVALLPAHQQPAVGPVVADALAAGIVAAAAELAARERREVRPVALPGVIDRKAGRAKRRDERLDLRYDVPHRLDRDALEVQVAAGRAEVYLHVYDYQSARLVTE